VWLLHLLLHLSRSGDRPELVRDQQCDQISELLSAHCLAVLCADFGPSGGLPVYDGRPGADLGDEVGCVDRSPAAPGLESHELYQTDQL
jgi:hypothetical protein